MDLSRFAKNQKKINLVGNQITTLNWKNCPSGLQEIDLYRNLIPEMNWKNCPIGLIDINLADNLIPEMNWKGCPSGLKLISLHYNQITEMNWEGCPVNLEIFPKYMNDSFEEYKKTKEFLIRKTKPKRNINAEISANTVLPPNNKIKVFNNPTYKENFYIMLEEMKGMLENY